MALNKKLKPFSNVDNWRALEYKFLLACGLVVLQNTSQKNILLNEASRKPWNLNIVDDTLALGVVRAAVPDRRGTCWSSGFI